MKILRDGGFSRSAAGSYLDRLAQTGSAFAATVPAGSTERIMIDPETLYAFDVDGDNMISCASTEDAIPVFAAGIFEMPDMITWRERRARAMAGEEASPTP